jgi:SAM-dependent methyltransferase
MNAGPFETERTGGADRSMVHSRRLKESDIRPQDLFNRYLELSRLDIAAFFSDRSGFVDVDCPACGIGDRLPGLEKFGFTYVLCRACATLYVSPRPTRGQLDAYYREARSVKFWSTTFYKETEQPRREKMFRPRAALVKQIHTQRAMPGDGTFADIGSGFGVFLEEVAALGAFQRILGVEPNPDLAALCRERGFDVLEKPVEATGPADVALDFATAFEVIEHVFSPLDFLIAIRRLLAPHGTLLFTTLTVSGFDIQVLWEHSKSVYPPHHINLISVEGMRSLIERAGLDLVDLATPGTLDVDIVANIVREQPDVAVPRFVRSLLFDCDDAVRQAFQRFLQDYRLSSHIRVVARARGAGNGMDREAGT